MLCYGMAVFSIIQYHKCQNNDKFARFVINFYSLHFNEDQLEFVVTFFYIVWLTHDTKFWKQFFKNLHNILPT
jgi:hypothetical protein